MIYLRAVGRTVTCNCVFVGSKASFIYVRSLETGLFAGGKQTPTISGYIGERRLQMSLVDSIMHNSTCLNYSAGKKEPFYTILEEQDLCKSMFTEHPGG